MNSNVIEFFKKFPTEKKIFWAVLIFYLLLLVINPSNYLIAGSFGLIFLMFYWLTKNFTWSLLFTFVTSLIVRTGKDYPIMLLPSGVFPLTIFPNGYFIRLTITPSHIISFVIVVYIIREILSKKIPFEKYRISIAEVFLILFITFKFISDSFASKEPLLSLTSELLSLNGIVLYFYVRFVAKKFNQVQLKQLIYLLAALVAFESILAFFQIITQSPLYKNLEYQVNIEYFGHTIDEPQFTFRPVGTFDHANALGIWLASELVLIAAVIAKYKSNIIWLTFLTGTVALITTLSRSAWLGFIFGVIALLFFLKKFKSDVFRNIFSRIWRWRLVLVIISILILFFFVLPRAENSLYSFASSGSALFFRETLIQDALEIIKLKPFLGVGSLMGVYEGLALNLYSVAASIPLVVHNWYISLAMENGIPTLFFFIFFLIFSLRNLWLKFKTPPIILLGLISVIICSSISSSFQPYANIDLILLLIALSNRDIIEL